MTNLTLGLVTVFFMGAFVFQTNQQKKIYKVEAPIEFWVNTTNGLEYVKQQLKQSDLPSKTVTLINDSLLNSIQSEISKQVNAQLASENKKDTTKPKK